ncbi:thioesterase family protein [Rhodococcus qingshengii]|uniref:thioesterase family protein n=1 Tax=Rhodococcus qingshengii TaxID=334542 RepID=UPI002ABE4DE8|nr:thioesterase family protein [Rhodococcus qingshengii]
MAITSQASVAAAPSTDAARHHTEFDSSWRSFDGIQGGLAIARMLRVAADASGAEPLAVTAHLDRPVPPGPAELTVGEMRGGRTVSCHVTLTGSGSALVRLARDIGATTMSAPVAEPAPADPSTLPPLEIPVDFVPFAQHLDIRPINSARPFAGGDSPEFDVWIRLLTDLDFTAQERAAVLLDALPPGLFATLTMPVAIPTIEFTAHFTPEHLTADPRTLSPWYRLRHGTAWATNTLCVDESELFDSTGRLAARARQLRRILS